MDKHIYIHSEAVHNMRAPLEVAPIIMDMLKPKSILDVGCGLGTWLKAFQGLGVKDCLGVDGNHVDRSMLKMDAQFFHAQNLAEKWNLNRRFDLVISLEVAEHLSHEHADMFVRTLVNHADRVIFSAAIPGQGGQNHLNEQWLSYWEQKFSTHDFVLYDVLRPKIWNNPHIEVWYKQNMVLFCKRGLPLAVEIPGTCLDIVHPQLFSFYVKQASRAEMFETGKLGVRTAMSSLIKALRNKLK
jgi:SAM-dependent methyltransferase